MIEKHTLPRSPTIYYWLFLLLLLIAHPCHSANNVQVVIEGLSAKNLPEGLSANVRNSLSLVREESTMTEATVNRLFKQAEKEIKRAMQPFGYYQPVITSELNQADNKWAASFRIQPGPVTVIDSINVTIEGPAKTSPRVQQLVSNPPFRSGEALNHSIYNNYKQQLYDAVFNQGYLDANFTRSELRVNVERQQATIFLTLNSGPQYVFGDIRIEQSIIQPEFIERLITIKPNTPFNTNRLLDLQLALTDTGYFSQIDIDIQKEQTVDNAIPVIVTATPAKKLKYSVSAGYGTDTGARVGFSVLNRRVNSLGHSIQYNMRLSEVDSNLNTQYKIPIGNFYSEHWDFFASGNRETINDTETIQYNIGSSINQNRWSGRRRLSLTVVQETFSFDDTDEQVANLLIPGLIYSYTHANNALFARKGYSITADIHGGLEFALSETTFVFGKVTGRTVYPLGKSGRLLNRLEIGAISSDDFDELPPSQRFFTGGSQSVRGYGYKDISPEDSNGNLIGGQYLVAGSIEMDRLFWGNHGAAIFYDAGDVADDTNFELKTAAGIGYRYRSPVGMIRIDLAHPFDAPDTDVRLHISIGPDL